jgi:hypothetical protein
LVPLTPEYVPRWQRVTSKRTTGLEPATFGLGNRVPRFRGARAIPSAVQRPLTLHAPRDADITAAVIGKRLSVFAGCVTLGARPLRSHRTIGELDTIARRITAATFTSPSCASPTQVVGRLSHNELLTAWFVLGSARITALSMSSNPMGRRPRLTAGRQQHEASVPARGGIGLLGVSAYRRIGARRASRDRDSDATSVPVGVGGRLRRFAFSGG